MIRRYWLSLLVLSLLGPALAFAGLYSLARSGTHQAAIATVAMGAIFGLFAVFWCVREWSRYLWGKELHQMGKSLRMQ